MRTLTRCALLRSFVAFAFREKIDNFHFPLTQRTYGTVGDILKVCVPMVSWSKFIEKALQVDVIDLQFVV